MSSHSTRSTRLRVAIANHGLGGVADELRRVLATVRTIQVLPFPSGSDIPDASSVIATPDVVVLTWGAGSELASALAATRRLSPDAAVVVVVPCFDDAFFAGAIRAGAEDCITPAQLTPSDLRRVLVIAAERHRLTSSLRVAAFSDELTGLYNRRGYVTRAAALLKVADPKTIWQIFFDVDELKLINDTYGHWAGDRALMEVASVLRQAFRSTDIVARVGGDEFAVLAIAPADASPDAWTARWKEPLAALASRRDLPLSVSVGLAQPDEQGQMTPEDLLTRADTTMYMAKRLRKRLASTVSIRPIVPLASTGD